MSNTYNEPDVKKPELKLLREVKNLIELAEAKLLVYGIDPYRHNIFERGCEIGKIINSAYKKISGEIACREDSE